MPKSTSSTSALELYFQAHGLPDAWALDDNAEVTSAPSQELPRTADNIQSNLSRLSYQLAATSLRALPQTEPLQPATTLSLPPPHAVPRPAKSAPPPVSGVIGDVLSDWQRLKAKHAASLTARSTTPPARLSLPPTPVSMRPSYGVPRTASSEPQTASRLHTLTARHLARHTMQHNSEHPVTHPATQPTRVPSTHPWQLRKPAAPATARAATTSPPQVLMVQPPPGSPGSAAGSSSSQTMLWKHASRDTLSATHQASWVQPPPRPTTLIRPSRSVAVQTEQPCLCQTCGSTAPLIPTTTTAPPPTNSHGSPAPAATRQSHHSMLQRNPPLPSQSPASTSTELRSAGTQHLLQELQQLPAFAVLLQALQLLQTDPTLAQQLQALSQYQGRTLPTPARHHSTSASIGDSSKASPWQQHQWLQHTSPPSVPATGSQPSRADASERQALVSIGNVLPATTGTVRKQKPGLRPSSGNSEQQEGVERELGVGEDQEYVQQWLTQQAGWAAGEGRAGVQTVASIHDSWRVLHGGDTSTGRQPMQQAIRMDLGSTAVDSRGNMQGQGTVCGGGGGHARVRSAGVSGVVRVATGSHEQAHSQRTASSHAPPPAAEDSGTGGGAVLPGLPPFLAAKLREHLARKARRQAKQRRAKAAADVTAGWGDTADAAAVDSGADGSDSDSDVG